MICIRSEYSKCGKEIKKRNPYSVDGRFILNSDIPERLIVKKTQEGKICRRFQVTNNVKIIKSIYLSIVIKLAWEEVAE